MKLTWRSRHLQSAAVWSGDLRPRPRQSPAADLMEERTRGDNRVFSVMWESEVFCLTCLLGQWGEHGGGGDLQTGVILWKSWEHRATQRLSHADKHALV